MMHYSPHFYAGGYERAESFLPHLRVMHSILALLEWEMHAVPPDAQHRVLPSHQGWWGVRSKADQDFMYHKQISVCSSYLGYTAKSVFWKAVLVECS